MALPVGRFTVTQDGCSLIKGDVLIVSSSSVGSDLTWAGKRGMSPVPVTGTWGTITRYETSSCAIVESGGEEHKVEHVRGTWNVLKCTYPGGSLRTQGDESAHDHRCRRPREDQHTGGTLISWTADDQP